MKDNNNKIILLIVMISVICTIMYLSMNKDKENPSPPNNINEISEFDYKIIKQTNNYYSKQNYMISPMSMAYALSMVSEGADGNTKDEITKLLGNYKVDTKINIKDKIGIANLIFISNQYKNDINKDYIKLLQEKHDSEVLFDDFDTPKPVNDWISDKTFKMINDAIEDIPKEMVLGIANAIAIDVEWKNKFEPNNTRNQEFTKEDNTKMNTAMMHSTNDFTYIENDNAKGIIKDYAIYDKTSGEIVYNENDNTVALEYIAILPNTNIDDYLKLFNKEELNSLLSNKKTANEKLDLRLSLPKYTYDFDYKYFQNALIELGMKDAFNPQAANFKKMLNSNSNLEIYISKSIHKSHIELSENGTKAAAVTIFMFEKNALVMEDEKEIINIEFNKPFIYLIKEKNSDNIWFFGTVYEPMKWEDNKK